MLEEGDFVSESELARELLADKDHPLARKLIAAEEGEISCEPTPQKIFVAHYRAEPTAQFSLRDDRILIAVKRDDGFGIYALQSETVVSDGSVSSENDFEEEFITIEGMHFLYIPHQSVRLGGNRRKRCLYGIQQPDTLDCSASDVTKSTVLKEGEELRNGGYRLDKGTFSFESGVYKNHKMANAVLRWGTLMLSSGWKESSIKTHTATLLSRISSLSSQDDGEHRPLA